MPGVRARLPDPSFPSKPRVCGVSPHETQQGPLDLFSGGSDYLGSQAPAAGSTTATSNVNCEPQGACFLQQGVLTNPQAGRQVLGGED